MGRAKTYFFFLSVALISCNSGKLAPKEYVHYIEDPGNGLLLKQTVNGIQYTLQYQPIDYLVMMELRSFEIPSDTFKNQCKRFNGLEHYNLRIDRKDVDDFVNKSGDSVKKEKIIYFDFGIKKDIKLVEGVDTLSCAICECESDGNIFPYYSFMLGFPDKNYDGDRQFVYSNKKLGIGDAKLIVSGNSVKNIPALKMM